MGLLTITKLAAEHNASITIELIKEGYCFIGVDLGDKGNYINRKNYKDAPTACKELKKVLGEITYPKVLFDDKLAI